MIRDVQCRQMIRGAGVRGSETEKTGLTCEVGGSVGGNCQWALGECSYGYDPEFQGVPRPEVTAGGKAGETGNLNDGGTSDGQVTHCTDE